MPRRSTLLVCLVVIVLASSTAAAATHRWSAHAPAAGDEVVIPTGMTVIYDVPEADAVVLRELTIEAGARLVFEDTRDTRLIADRLTVYGTLEVGTEAVPFAHRATIVLTNVYGVATGDDFVTTGSGLSTCSLVVDGGTLDLHGTPRASSWTRLEATAAAGSDRLIVQHGVDWQAGDRLVVASTDFDLNQAEEVTIAAVTSTHQPNDTVELTDPLGYLHYGDEVGEPGHEISERAEVGLLSRNIVITSDDHPRALGGQMRFVDDSGATPQVRMQWVEVRKLGRYNTMGWYPVHFHMVGDGSSSYVRYTAIYHCYFRGITCHSTNDLELTGNLVYETHGHAYYLEEKTESGCVLTGNLGLGVRAIPEGAGPVVPSDATPGVFYVSPPNQLIGNAAAGCEGNGFYYTVETPWVATPPVTFVDNVTHSNGDSGLWQDDHILFEPDGPSYQNLTSYKNRRHSIWLRAHGQPATVVGARIADSGRGVYLATGGWQDPVSELILLDSHVFGESANVGTPDPANAHEVARGRSLPVPSDPLQASVGVELYDGHLVVDGVWFGGFEHLTYSDGVNTVTRQGGAIAPTTKLNRWAVDPRNMSRNLQFAAACNRVWFRQPEPGITGVASAMVYDLDGSLTGTAHTRVVTNTPLMLPGLGEIYRSRWNAWVVAGDVGYGQLQYLNRSNTIAFTRLAVRGLHAPAPHQVNTPPTTNHKRFATNLPTAEVSSPDPFTYLVVPTSADPPRRFRCELRLGIGEQAAVVAFPYPSAPPSRVYDTAGDCPEMASLAALRMSFNQAWYWDASADRLFLKLVLPSGGVLQGLETHIEVR